MVAVPSPKSSGPSQSKGPKSDSPSQKGEGNNISVAVRMRPLGRSELIASDTEVWSLTEGYVQGIRSVGRPEDKFGFDHVFGPQCATHTCYDAVCAGIIAGAFEGYNGTIFCYGQTASGKTHTMVGSAVDPGVTMLAVHDTFDKIMSDSSTDFLIYISYLEIYNEKIMDLLRPQEVQDADDEARPGLEVYEDKQRGPYVKGLTEVVCCTPENVLEMITMGLEARHISSTEMNMRSSRSHTIFRMVVESRKLSIEIQEQRKGRVLTKWEERKKGAKQEHPVKMSSLYMVDLAGSERVGRSGLGEKIEEADPRFKKEDSATKNRFKEGANINRSLLTLSTVIAKLSSSASGHIPYRDSKLTRLLSTSLGGNARTVLLCCISPATSNEEESRSTLQFGKRAQRVKNRARVNEAFDENALLHKYRAEVSELRAKLKSYEEGEAVPMSPTHGDGGSSDGGISPDTGAQAKLKSLQRLILLSCRYSILTHY
jgi:centromeric protein E